MPSIASSSQLVQLDLAGISVSAGSACSSGSMKPSRVLAAMGVAAALAAARSGQLRTRRPARRMSTASLGVARIEKPAKARAA